MKHKALFIAGIIFIFTAIIYSLAQTTCVESQLNQGVMEKKKTNGKRGGQPGNRNAVKTGAIREKNVNTLSRNVAFLIMHG